MGIGTISCLSFKPNVFRIIFSFLIIVLHFVRPIWYYGVYLLFKFYVYLATVHPEIVGRADCIYVFKYILFFYMYLRFTQGVPTGSKM